MTDLKTAQAKRICRICEQPIGVSTGRPAGWTDSFGEQLYPVRLTLNYGEEFAHTACLEKAEMGQDVVSDTRTDTDESPAAVPTPDLPGELWMLWHGDGWLVAMDGARGFEGPYLVAFSKAEAEATAEAQEEAYGIRTVPVRVK
jgi:hypothetical protein